MAPPTNILTDDSILHRLDAPLTAENVKHAARVYCRKMRESLYQSGAVTLMLSDAPSTEQLSDALRQLFASPIQIVPISDAVAYPAAAHTVLPGLAIPPRFITLLNRSPRAASLSLAPVASVRRFVTPEAASVLRTTKIRWKDTGVSHPVLITHRRLRFNPDLIDTSGLPPMESEAFIPAFVELTDLLNDECLLSRNNVLLPPASITIFDNHRFAHRLRAPKGTALDAVAFDIPTAPELGAALLEASRCPLFKPDFVKTGPLSADDLISMLDLSKWPVVQKSAVISRVNSLFAETFHSRGGLYWSAPGGSTNPDAFKSTSVLESIPIRTHDMRQIRARLSELYIDHGAADGSSVAVNLMTMGNGARSLEVQTEVFANLNASEFPLETRALDEHIARAINCWGATVITGHTTRLVQLGIFCHREGVRLPTVRSILHGGEQMVGDRQIGALADVCAADVKIFELYGSAEIGVFSIRPAGQTFFETVSDCMVLEALDEYGQAVPEGCMGRLVVTNVARKEFSQIRFDTLDIGCLADMNKDNGKTFFKLQGRNPDAIKRQFGDLAVKWFDVLNGEIGQCLYKTFDGCCLFQVVVEKDMELNGDSREEAVLGKEQCETKCVTLVVYAKEIGKEERAALEKTLMALMRNVFTAKARVWRVAVQWAANGLELRRVERSQKLKTFA